MNQKHETHPIRSASPWCRPTPSKVLALLKSGAGAFLFALLLSSCCPSRQPLIEAWKNDLKKADGWAAKVEANEMTMEYFRYLIKRQMDRLR